ncbi:RNA polymerase sigma-54 factor, partial [Parabacteroides distasonis]
FDPAGIGAQSLQECLLLQIDRRPDSTMKNLMNTVIQKYFDQFMKKDWNTIKSKMNLNDVQAEYLNRELCKLNPKPGATMGEIVGRNIEQITPDAIIDTNDDGTITFTLNNSNIPHLQVSSSFLET